MAPLASAETRAIFEAALERNVAANFPIMQLDGRSREAMAASDVVLLASGTATLEAALLSRLMVVTYKVSALTYFVIRLFAHVKLYSLPNNLAGCQLVPELIQGNAVPEKLGRAVEHLLEHPEKSKSIIDTLKGMHGQLRRNANERAADAVMQVLSAQGIEA